MILVIKDNALDLIKPDPIDLSPHRFKHENVHFVYLSTKIT